MKTGHVLGCSAVALGVVLAWACGDRTGLPIGPLVCKETAVGVIQKVPNLYFVLDRSNSMNEMTLGGGQTKWNVVRQAVADLMVQLGTQAEYGAAWFPGPGLIDRDLGCVPGLPVMSLRPGDGLPATTPGSTAAEFLADTDSPPMGGTPTAQTFANLQSTLTSFPGRTFAILATDGGPNCNLSLTCPASTCTANIDLIGNGKCYPGGGNCCSSKGPLGSSGGTWNCLDGTDTVAAVTDLAQAGVPTFAIGVPGSEAYADVLDDVATAGKTARATQPYYYPVKSSAELVSALTDIARRITACTLELKENPPDPSQVNVVVQKNQVPQGGGNGWTLDGNIVSLEGQTCDEAVAGEKVLVTFGCPTAL